MNHRKMLIASAGAAALGIVAMHTYLERFETEIAGGEPRQVLMITRDLPLGARVTRASLDSKALPESYVEERHILAADLDQVIGTRVTSAVSSGSALLWTDLDTMQDGRTLSGLVRVGMRAYSLPERDVSFGGLLRPGDRVDVLFTPRDSARHASTLLSNVLVLTVGQDLGLGNGQAGDQRAGWVTLNVAPEQAELLARHEGVGRFRLSLRNPQDSVALDAPSPNAEHGVRAQGAEHAQR